MGLTLLDESEPKMDDGSPTARGLGKTPARASGESRWIAPGTGVILARGQPPGLCDGHAVQWPDGQRAGFWSAPGWERSHVLPHAAQCHRAFWRHHCCCVVKRSRCGGAKPPLENWGSCE